MVTHSTTTHRGASSLKSAVWRLLFSRWQSQERDEAPGYTVLLPVPADLPFLTEIALAVCARQDARQRSEILVIPDDEPRAEFTASLERARARHDGMPLRLVTLSRVARTFTRRGNGHLNHFLQIIHGIDAAHSEHVLLHDADAFLHDPSFLRDQYENCVAGDYHAYGVHPVWDDWYRDHGYAHVSATWELMFRRSWARSFQPHEHRGQPAWLNGHRHVVDTMLLPQCRTEPERIGRRERPGGFVHFNYVICTYRAFLRSSSSSIEDDRFRLLLIRLLHDAVRGDERTESCPVPSYDELRRGLRDRMGRVRYSDLLTAENFVEFRDRFEELLLGGVLESPAVERLRERLEPFERHFGWRPLESRAAPAPTSP